MIVLVVRPETQYIRQVAESLKEWFRERPRDLLEMEWNPLLVYVALYSCFNSFGTILTQYETLYHKVVSLATRLLLQSYAHWPQALLQERNTAGIFGRTYQCNKCLVSMSYCQQEMLAHGAALEKLQALLPPGMFLQPHFRGHH